MAFAVISVLLAAAIALPQLWIRYVMFRHGKERADIEGTGGELARHLLQRFEMPDYVVELTGPRQDHFDPAARAVRLSPSVHDGRSLTAVAVATHEVGHALQHHRNETIFQLRSKYLPFAIALKKIGIWIMMLVPFVVIAVKAPVALFALAGVSIVLQLLGALSYLIVLPEEWDASFNKALPILAEGYVPASDAPAVRQVLKAAALTYFAGALADILNVGRWLLLLRR